MFGVRLVLLLALIAWLASARVASALPVPQPIDQTGGDLVWIKQPNIMDLGKIADDLGGPEGRAVVECVLDKNHRPGACVVVEEAPAGRGLGKLAIRMAALFKAATKDTSGAPVVGRRIRYAVVVGRAYIP